MTDEFISIDVYTDGSTNKYSDIPFGLEGCYVEGSLNCPECSGMIVWRNFVETPLTD
jgi:hypothetical protein